MRRPHLRRAVTAFTTVALLLPVFALTAHAEVATVTGTLTFAEKVTLSPTAVAVITLADRSKTTGAGTIIGQQRIDAAKGPQIPFSVEYDTSTVVANHAYAVVASVIDAGVEWQNPVAVPAITGGTTGLAVVLSVPEYTTPAQVTGTITPPAGTTLSPTAVTYAIILNAEGRVIGRQVNPAPTGAAIPFTVTYDADLVDPASPITAVGAAADGTTLWKTAAPATVTAGTPVDLAVAPSGNIPGATPLPTGQPTPTASGSVEPTVKPTGNPTAEPTATPTEAPTEAPTATPTTAPTEAPTPTPTASAVPSVTPSASPSPSPSPGAVIVSGTLTYREPHRLDITSYARVVVAQLQAGDQLTLVGEQDIANPGAVPIAFAVTLNSEYDPAIEARLWAVIADGTDVWTTALAGLAVAGPSGPTENVLVGMFYRPDLIEADVTGTISGTPTDLSTSAWTMTWILDTTNGTIVGLDSSLALGANPIPFQVPFAVADVTATGTYVVSAAVFDGEREWRSSEGVPVISAGKPLKDVQVTVAQVAPTASPTPAATATPAGSPAASGSPAPTPTPTGGTGSGGGVDPFVLGILALVVIGGAVVVYFVRR